MSEFKSSQTTAYLQAMGIEVWRERNPSITAVTAVAEVVPTLQAAPPQVSEPVIPDTTAVPLSISPGSTAPSVPDVATLGWEELRLAVAECKQCALSASRTKTVFGSGNTTASVMLVTDSPGKEEELAADPVTGEAGQLLSAMLKAIGLLRHEVYITNITKCGTPGQREPSDEETQHCWPYLKRQIELVQPELILVLGLTAAQRLLNSRSTLNRLRGQPHLVENITCPVFVSYHPAYLLRSANEKRKAWEDLQMIMQQLKKN